MTFRNIVKHPFRTIFIILTLSIVFNLYSNNSYSTAKEKSGNKKLEDVAKSLQGKSTRELVNTDTKVFSKNEFLSNIISRVKEDYVEEKTDDEIAKSAAKGILTALDPHSSYLSLDDYQEMKVQTKGEFGGVGIEITVDNTLIKVVSPIEGTPAYEAGIKAGDYISKIDGQSTIDITIEEAVSKLRGKPNSKINITVIRKGEENPLEFYIRRAVIKIKAVRSNKYEDVAYVKINSFSEQTYLEVSDSITKLIGEIGKKKIKGIILDLRNNPGGLLDQSVKVSDLFLDKDQMIVSIKGRNADSNKEYKDEANQTITKDIPVVVLINEGSASASEIVAGALQDNSRALILGQKSFGKGSVQSIIPLGNKDGAIRMTTALYYTPSGKSIQAKGIRPDVVVTEATIAKVDTKDVTRTEASLNGHIKSDGDKKSTKSNIGDDNIDLYNDDYQLARAIDLVRGISFYKKINEL